MASKETELKFALHKFEHEVEAEKEELVLKTQKELLKKAKAKENESVSVSIGNALKRQLASENEDGVPLADELVAKTLAGLKHKDKLTVSEISGLQNMLGESKQTVDVNVDAKGGLEDFLAKINTGKGF